MPRIFLLLLLFAAGSWLWRWYKQTPPQVRNQLIQEHGMKVLVAALVILTVTGQLNLLVALAGAVTAVFIRLLPLFQLLPMLRRIFGQLGQSGWPPIGGSGPFGGPGPFGGAGPGPFGGQGPFGGSGPFGGTTGSRSSSSSSQSSSVHSRFVRMSLDHRSGEIRGEVLEGRFAGRWLNQLSFDELLQLLSECQVDQESAALVQAYLDRVHGDQWRTHARTGGGSSSSGGQRRQQPPPTGGTMTRDEAYEILGLKPGASAKDVTDAHRRLMQKMHPDRGGSDYLAAKINQAKDVLLGR